MCAALPLIANTLSWSCSSLSTETLQSFIFHLELEFRYQEGEWWNFVVVYQHIAGETEENRMSIDIDPGAARTRSNGVVG
jgi:hypothetical protein